jgi:predicted lactoylglutathione lyase
MARSMFVNLPVKDLKKSMLFFAQLGFHFDPQFTDDNAACMIVGEGSYVMLLMEAFFQGFTKKAIVDAHQSTEVITALSADSRAEVDTFVDHALRIGGIPNNDAQDIGFMYSRSFYDIDGHLWEVVWMDMTAFPQG